MHKFTGYLMRCLLVAALAVCLPQAASAKASKGAQVHTAATQLYGKYVFRMRAANGSGLISSFFTWKTGSELPGAFWEEIDVEVLGRDNAQTWQSNLITGQGTRIMSPQLHSAGSSFADTYHTYTIEWTPTSITFLVDGQVVRTTTGGQASTVRSPSTLRFDFWAANNPGWSGAWNPNILPVQMFVNWVEFYSWNGAGFNLAWRDDFNSFDSSRWVREAHTFDGNEVDFITENAVVRNGFLVLAMTREGQPTGFTGTPPADNGGGGCTPTAITPNLRVNGGTWQQVSSVAINAGNSVQFGPQPASGGSWTWSGCGTSGSAREQTVAPGASCTATAIYTNACGATSTQNFAVTVAGSSSSSGGGTSSSSSGGGSCPDIKTGGQSGNLNTTGAYCFRVQSGVNGWGVSNLSGRTVSVTVNGAGTAVTSPGAPLPSKGANDYYHFNISAGGVPWASVYWW